MTEKNYAMGALMPLIEQTLASGDPFLLQVNGSSMLPLLRHGQDSVVLESLQNHTVCRGSIVLFERADGRFVMHRVYKVSKDGTYAFVGDNQVRVEYGVRQEQFRAFVPYVLRGNRKICCTGGFTHRMLILYMLLRVHHPRPAYGLLRLTIRIKKALHITGGRHVR